ncbi:ROK family protein [Neptunomonas sp.]|uniref:ROK family protein n=2 Tax=Neptunomonas sp. TaxID=1971898 RepID=UPI003562A8E8
MRLGIDLGGTKIEIIALERNAVIYRKRVATPQGDYPATLAAIANLVQDAELKTGFKAELTAGLKARTPASIGIGIPGVISADTQKVKNANSTCLIGKPLQHDLETLLARPVRIANDANCFALSEAIDGAGQSGNVVFGVILGTGVGGGLVVNQQVLCGCNGITGEWGHNPLPWPGETEYPGPVCYCGQKGCIETFISGPGALQRHLESSKDQHISSFAQVWKKAATGCQASEAACQTYIDRLAKSLASVINILDPDIIVLGGGLSNIERLYSEVPKQWSRYVFSDSVKTALRKAQHGDSSGVRGAAWLWPG